jgi:hypothetical protein
MYASASFPSGRNNPRESNVDGASSSSAGFSFRNVFFLIDWRVG